MISTSSHLPYGASPPAHWKVVPLKHLSKLSNGFAFKSDSWEDAGTPILRIENLNGSNSFNYSKLALDERYKVTAGDLLYSWSGNPGTSFGPFRWARDGSYYLNQHIFKAAVHGCDTDWLYWSLRAATHWIERELTSGMIGMVHVTKDELGRVPIPLPPPEEQRRIADFLDAETARIEKLSAHRRAQMELLTERFNTVWGETIEADGNRAGWSPIRRFLDAITDGPFGSALTSSHYTDSGARVIRLGNIGRGNFRNHDAAFISSTYFMQLQRHEAVGGDLVVAGLGDQNNPLGRACVVPEGLGPAIVKADCFRLRLHKARMLHEYAAWALSSPPVSEQIAVLARGSTRARINLEIVREVAVPAPSITQQLRAMTFLAEARSVTESARTRCSRQLDLLAERRQALITAAVTGQIDVSTASGRGIEE
ncbi:restriction endonuclease subunit S [Streptomyces sp. NPDC058255]|uniref:restriction endonuclease subunit S n=1 Tax=Streptomyces sp. NPDC058255 TaxID=3346407 RepID=UPI0036E33DC2